MKQVKQLLLVFAIGLFAIFNCDSPTDEGSENRVILQGQVLNSNTGAPIINAVVRVLFPDSQLTASTDTQGRYRFEFEVENTLELEVIAFRESFRADTTTVLAVPGRTVDVPLLRLTATSSTPSSSGEAASMFLQSISTETIGVRESGALESARLTFEVQDSSGNPVDFDHAVEVFFKFGAAPGGGEFIHPLSAITGNNGHAETFLFSGTVAGAVQIIAEINTGDKIIRSKPVSIAIHGGLPDFRHFSVATENLNFPGYNIFGLANAITAIVGDKYTNPVRPNTVVYFATTGGIIVGSALTTLEGEATANLISGAPQPTHEVLGPGFATVTARTIDENDQSISTDVVVLFSGIPTISIDPTTFDIPHLGSQTFFYTVSDQNNNPLAGGTQIKVEVEGEKIKSFGSLDVTLPDTQSRSWTQFSFTVADADSQAQAFLRPVLIEINVSGPNGGALLDISGTVR